MFLFYVWSSTSKRSNVSFPSRGYALDSITTIKLIAIVKASNNNQWLLDWFITMLSP
jgi:hypothetical protein